MLEELGLEVEFPPSSTILIPLALITHYNTPIQAHETCFSIVQYAAGGLFRWAKNRYMTDKTWNEMAMVEEKEQRQRDDAERMRKWLEKFTTYDELIM